MSKVDMWYQGVIDADEKIKKINKSIEKSNKKIELYQKLISKLKKGKISIKEYTKEFRKIKRM
jgi:hypothetical protein